MVGLAHCTASIPSLQVRHAQVPAGRRGQVGGQPPRLRHGRHRDPVPGRASAKATVTGRAGARQALQCSQHRNFQHVNLFKTKGLDCLERPKVSDCLPKTDRGEKNKGHARLRLMKMEDSSQKVAFFPLVYCDTQTQFIETIKCWWNFHNKSYLIETGLVLEPKKGKCGLENV